MLRTAVNSAVRRSATPAATCFHARTGSITAVVSQRYYSSGSIHDNDPELLEQEKQRNLRKEQHHTSTPHEHAPGWNEYLASTSEAYTKADKSGVSIDELQQKTVQYVNKRHPTMTEKVADTVSSAVNEIKEAASEVKDTIMGPLASASGNKPTSPDIDTAQDTPVRKKKFQPTRSEEAVKADRNEL